MLKLLEKTYYEAPLPSTQRPGAVETSVKHGALYKIETNEGVKEINLSPFPGFSNYSLEETCHSFEEAFLTPETKEEHCERNPHIEYAFYQIEQAFLTKEEFTIKENELVKTEELVEHIKNQRSNNVIKFKIDQKFIESDNLLNQLSMALTNNSCSISLRPDANQSLQACALSKFWRVIKERGIEKHFDYFEEPLLNFEEYQDLPPDLPFAHEELLFDYLNSPNKATAVIVKPSQKGFQVLEKLKAMGVRIILSSAYEFEEDLGTLRQLANTYSPQEFHGLKAFLSRKNIHQTKTIKF